MPHNGDGSSQNGPFEEAGHPIIHGTEKGSNVDRSDKSVPLPEGIHEKGAGLEGMNASGGQSQGIKKGPDVGQGGGAK